MSEIRLSPYLINDFLSCKRKYWYKYKEKIEPKVFNVYYFIGAVVHSVIHHMYKDKELDLNVLHKLFNNELAKVRKKYFLNSSVDQKVMDTKPLIIAMMKGYFYHNQKNILSFDQLFSEYKFEVKLDDDITLSGVADNILVKGSKKYLHEIKSTRVLTSDYVLSVQNNHQVAFYFHALNLLFLKEQKEPINGIMFDMIQKSSIRQKKNESKSMFSTRLEAYYGLNPDSMHLEIIKEPLRLKDEFFNTIYRIGDFLKNHYNKDEFYTSDTYCNVYSRCEFYNECYGLHGEKTRNVLLKGVTK